MHLQDELKFTEVFIQQLNDNIFTDSDIELYVLRLDKIHPVISGNKWFKLKYFLQQAIVNNCKVISTFGGAFSNHIIATAYVCNKQNIDCIGYIRGEEPKRYSQTLLDAKVLNMQLKFLSRDAFANKQVIIQSMPGMFFIPEGGYGIAGAKGAAEIAQLITNFSSYNYIICAAGTGTMLAGIANASLPHQQCIGVSVMKNNLSLENEMLLLVRKQAKSRIAMLHDYHFGGYAKHTKQLIDFMNDIWIKHRLPLDFVYTAKSLYALHHLAAKKYFMPGSKILFIHSGGLQGNRSLNRNILLYN